MGGRANLFGMFPSSGIHWRAYLPLFVELFTLGNGIENPEIRSCVGSATGCPLPTLGIACQIGIDQGIPKPTGSFCPWKEEVLDKERGYDHPDTVMHPSCLIELAHSRVNHGVASPSGFPVLQGTGVGKPGEIGILWAKRMLGGMWEMIEQMIGKFTPSDLGEKFIFSTVVPIGFVLQDGMTNLPGADQSPSEIRRQAGRSIRSRGVSKVCVRVDDFA